MASVFRIDESGVNELFNSPRGDVNQYMEKAARRIVVLARANVPKSSGRLAASIGYRMLRSAEGVYVEVEASNRVALLVHEGSRPHIITGHHGRELRFKRGGKVIYARQIMHPGTRPHPYLVTALREVIQ